jgi:hypothetical protein
MRRVTRYVMQTEIGQNVIRFFIVPSIQAVRED